MGSRRSSGTRTSPTCSPSSAPPAHPRKGRTREYRMPGEPPSNKTILVLATLDTKGPEAQYLRECIEARGDRAIVIDTGVAHPPQARADIAREEVARAGGKPLEELRRHLTREEAAPVMTAGATRIVRDLV